VGETAIDFRTQENLGLPRRDILVRIDYEKCGTLVRECSKNQIFLATFAERVAQFQCQLFFDDEGVTVEPQVGLTKGRLPPSPAVRSEQVSGWDSESELSLSALSNGSNSDKVSAE